MGALYYFTDSETQPFLESLYFSAIIQDIGQKLAQIAHSTQKFRAPSCQEIDKHSTLQKCQHSTFKTFPTLGKVLLALRKHRTSRCMKSGTWRKKTYMLTWVNFASLCENVVEIRVRIWNISQVDIRCYA